MGGYTADDVARRVGGPDRPGRTPFQRDRARVLHSGALRRLAGKTQVVEPEGDGTGAPRTRLTHSLECSQVGRELGGALGCDPDLVDAACLAHDLGHPPFGHNGEAALDAVAQACGGFEGNAQSFRLLVRLEPKVQGAGLDLTRATLDAALKYPWLPDGRRKYGAYDDDAEAFTWVREGAPGQRRAIEAQVMDWADDVAYSVHDLEDGVAAGHVDLGVLREEADEVAALAAEHYSGLPAAALRDAFVALQEQPWWPAEADDVALKTMTSTLIGRLCRSAELATRERFGPEPLTRYAADLVVPERSRAECALLKAVAARYVMRRPGVPAAQEAERALLTDLVERLLERAPAALEASYAVRWHEAADDAGRLRAVVDQVAGLTDAGARALLRRLR